LSVAGYKPESRVDTVRQPIASRDAAPEAAAADPPEDETADVGDPDLGGLILDDGDGRGARRLPLPPVTVRSVPAGSPKPQPPAPPPPTKAATPAERLLAIAAASPPTKPISVTIGLEDLPADWASYRKMNEDDKAAFIEQREKAIAAAQAPLKAWLASIGATNPHSSWLVNDVRVELPAGALPQLLTRPEIESFAGDEKPHALVSLAWTGKEAKDGLRITNLYANGITGHDGNSHRRRIRIAVIEAEATKSENWPMRDHPGWKKWAPGRTSASRASVIVVRTPCARSRL
jgi:pyruvate/2-oxoglutarate dehydrogenase complex dihydrolipoamide acyltransferase (E2) component